jgi:EAL domain-containing protein (putative c-di-GMP-specific phosphodiesterase class I)
MRKLLEKTPGMADRLVVEITETAEIEQEDEAIRMIGLLRDHNIPVCLDDFGAGAAAFRYLRAFNVDYVKVDGIYVANALQSERDRGFIAAMVDLARTVGAQVVAERIETEAEAALMLELGVKYGQGYLFGKPELELAARKTGLAWQEEK